MQLIQNGPDIPNELLQAHEEGKVVFFCGAGISYPSGLPGFKGLVDAIYKKIGTKPSSIESKALDREQYDVVLDLLERRLPGQRSGMRPALAQALKPNLRRNGATDTHTALLELACNRKDELRLVTTNFDRIFQAVAKKSQKNFNVYVAPMLPIPKNSRWNGVVYLHGLLPEKKNDVALNHLVVTSGDFGLAYLIERWAARFVSELLLNYSVCFVGYSINDPVLRYMMDALAADRMLGEKTPQAWAFGDCEPGGEKDKTTEWEAKGVKPILYHVTAETHDHSLLHKTLQTWAETYRDGLLGHQRIVSEYAMTLPSESTKQDDFVGRMLWALSHKSGLPAKRFADFNPVPSLEWLLEVFSHKRFQNSDLARFDLPLIDESNINLSFSLIDRPASYSQAPNMTLVSDGITTTNWDNVMFHLARWLTRHLDDPNLIIWIVQNGGKLNKYWRWLIEDKLNYFASQEQSGKSTELDEIRLHSPNAIPSPLMRTLWRLLLSGRVKSPEQNPNNIYRWRNRFRLEGLSTTLRMELRELLAPLVLLRKRIIWDARQEIAEKPTYLRQIVNYELALSTNNMPSALRSLNSEQWTSTLPQLLTDFQQLLLDALELLHELGEADKHSDPSHCHLPSITPHWQNRGFNDWVSLIELLRDAWLELRKEDKARSDQIAKNWFELPYPTFKRLALFAASQDDYNQPLQWMDWLLSDKAWCLWSKELHRETMRLLFLKGKQLSDCSLRQLEQAILQGPPREKFVENMTPEEWSYLQNSRIWVRLAKLKASGLELGSSASLKLQELCESNNDFCFKPHEREEFSDWMTGTGDPDYEENRDIDVAPRKRSQIVQWLTKSPSPKRPFYEDTWQDVCLKHPLNSFYALSDLADNALWPVQRWREALQIWSGKLNSEKSKSRWNSLSWECVAPLILIMPDSKIQEIIHGVAWWIETASKSAQEQDYILLDLCRRILDIEIPSSENQVDQPVIEAINHPIGHITEALIIFWFKSSPKDNDLLPKNIKYFFTKICDGHIKRFRHGRVILGYQVITLFRVDQGWTEQFLLPFFNWNNCEAKGVWQGFLRSPRLHQPLLFLLKKHFLDTANHYNDLGEYKQNFVRLLTYAALEQIWGYTVEEFQSAISALPQEGLEQCALTLCEALEGAGNQSDHYWKNRIEPFWQEIWPKSANLVTPKISESLIQLAIEAQTEFPSALATVKNWLVPIKNPYNFAYKLYESNLCLKFPTDALKALNIVTFDQDWLPKELNKCLEMIKQVAPELENDIRYRRLQEMCNFY